MARTKSKKTSIKDVANLAGVGVGTVSRVLNNEPNVSAKKRALILDAIEKLDYSPSLYARGLSGQKSFVLGLFCDDPRGDYVSGVMRGALLCCKEHNYHLIVDILDPDKPTDELNAFLKRSKLDGAIVLPPLCDDKMTLNVFDKNNVPIARISSHFPYPDTIDVGIDDYEASCEIMKHLLALGHKKIGLIKGDPGHSGAQKRYQAFVDMMEKSGIEVTRSYVKQGYYSYDSGLVCARELLTGSDRPTAIFASNDEMAAAVLSVAAELGIRVPDELSVIGFDDGSIAQRVWPSLSTVHQPVEEMARTAVDGLVKGLGRHDENILLDYQLIKRDSTGLIK